MVTERLEDAASAGRCGHEWRYRMAAGFVSPGDIVVDAACGTGYGQHLLPPFYGRWIGVDKELRPHHFSYGARADWVTCDLCTWEPEQPFDVGISFETIEHLDEYHHFVKMLKRAHKWILCSVPVVPTVGINPWHRHDFVPGDLVRLFEDEHWEQYQVLGQPSELAEVAVFRRIQLEAQAR